MNAEDCSTSIYDIYDSIYVFFHLFIENLNILIKLTQFRYTYISSIL